ncbi:MAG: HPr family phosphocarrier protein [candidate division WOR-3 bacterium]|jgi:phosphocarrier protein
MYLKKVVIVNKLGIHARPATKITEIANKFVSEIYIEKDGMVANAKSILGILMLVAPKGTELIIRAEGPDEVEAVESIAKIIEEGFGEEI